jgi:secondary thiamine-phosphate synthase enzyme
VIRTRSIELETRGKGLTEITGEVRQIVRESGIRTGLCSVFVLHTSASLLITENADPSARQDVEGWFERLAPESDPHYTHVLEGPDDMPSHLRSAVTRTSETIHVDDGDLTLGTWQGLFLFEHRRHPHLRRLRVRVMGELE